MRIQDSLEGAGDSFYFDHDNGGELVVRADVLPDGQLPEGTNILGRSIIGHYLNRDGVPLTKSYEINWREVFQPGERLVSVEAGSEDIVYGDENAEGYLSVHRGGEVTGQYELQPTDTLITRWLHHNPHAPEQEAVLLPAGEPFPGEERSGAFYPAGVITEAGKLVTWRNRAPWAVALAVANRLARSREDLHTLDMEVAGMSIVAVPRVDPVANIYLDFFRNRFGQDYFPQAEIWSRFDEFPLGGE